MTKTSIEQIRTDGGTQSRAVLDESVIDEYSESYAAGVELPPLVVFYDGSDSWLADGFHRLRGAERAGFGEVPVEVHQGTRRDAVLFSVGANAAHGLRRSNEDKRRAVTLLLKDEEWSAKSDRWIADKCGVSDMTVGRVRKELQQSGSSPPPARTGKDGKKRQLPRQVGVVESTPGVQVPPRDSGESAPVRRNPLERQVSYAEEVAATWQRLLEDERVREQLLQATSEEVAEFERDLERVLSATRKVVRLCREVKGR